MLKKQNNRWFYVDFCDFTHYFHYLLVYLRIENNKMPNNGEKPE